MYALIELLKREHEMIAADDVDDTQMNGIWHMSCGRTSMYLFLIEIIGSACDLECPTDRIKKCELMFGSFAVFFLLIAFSTDKMKCDKRRILQSLKIENL